MVSISYGKVWGAKVEEIANLKAAKQEIKDELRDAKQKLLVFESEIELNRKAKEVAEAKHSELLEKFNTTEEISNQRKQELIELKAIQTENEATIEELKHNLTNFQITLDKLHQSLQHSTKLEQDLRIEVKHGDTIRNRLEVERDQLRADLEKKCADFEILTKSKEHCERHIGILVKEKDRILNKNDSKPSVTSKIYQTPAIEEKVTNWGQVENQRLKSLLDEEKKESDLKTAQIEKLQKENWNLINRLRNKKAVN